MREKLILCCSKYRGEMGDRAANDTEIQLDDSVCEEKLSRCAEAAIAGATVVWGCLHESPC